ncbi:DUF2510 domain-containing protein [Nocardioides sp. AE5]|uniref:DUF2510 domain-containing protein n=1 Tax=Nocardioides sp. AE5 TaxID=2962573 RepID=UPI002882BB5C|nr:DUF2510 domain-containing protein [Nocardioides sp. AE5]MDT0200565.1 DUF2510 domain-containing protein [Nocardioides sp. AE5]
MSASGWYPDPSGEPNRFRYWDGSAWSSETTADPNSPAPGAASAPSPAEPPTNPGPSANPYVTGGASSSSYGQGAPGQSQYGQSQYGQSSYGQAQQGQGGYGQSSYGQATPGQYGQSSYGQSSYGQTQYGQSAYGAGAQGPTHQEYGRPKWLIPVIAIVAVLLVAGGIGLAVALTSGGDDDKTAGGEKTSQGPRETNDTDEPSDEPSEDETDGPTDGPTTKGPGADFANCTGGDPMTRTSTPVTGSIVGGNLTATVPDGFTPQPFYGEAFAFAYDTDVAYKEIEAYWISTLVVGRVEKADGFTTPQQAAHAIQECMTRTDTLYSGFTGSTDVHDKETTVDGHKAWSYRTEIRVNTPEVEAEGDLAEVTVVDIGDAEGYAVFIGVTPIGDDELAAVLDDVVAGLKVG